MTNEREKELIELLSGYVLDHIVKALQSGTDIEGFCVCKKCQRANLLLLNRQATPIQ